MCERKEIITVQPKGHIFRPNFPQEKNHDFFREKNTCLELFYISTFDECLLGHKCQLKCCNFQIATCITSPDLKEISSTFMEHLDWTKWLQQLAPLSNFCLLTDSGKVSLQNKRTLKCTEMRNVNSTQKVFFGLSIHSNSHYRTTCQSTSQTVNWQKIEAEIKN